MTPFVAARGIRKRYDSNVALDGVDLEIPPGICYGLLGPNGAGKSTLIGILSGTLTADEGTASLGGQTIGMRELSVKRRIGYVPQDLALYEELTAEENLRFFGVLFDLHGAKLQERVDLVLHVAGLRDRRSEIVRTYSGGMKRRLNLAAALLHDPDFLILDEPTVGVDPQSRNQIFESLEALLQAGKTILYTSHYMEEVERLCDRVAIIDRGKVIAEGQIRDLYALAPYHPRVEIDLADPALFAGTTLQAGANLNQKDSRLTLDAKDLGSDLAAVLADLTRQNRALTSIQTDRPSLEKVFLHLTGRELRD